MMVFPGKVHALKIDPEYFMAVARGDKTFEVRKNDRPFEVNDIIALNELDDTREGYSGRTLLLRITYILDNPEYVKEGYVVLGLCPLEVSEMPF